MLHLKKCLVFISLLFMGSFFISSAQDLEEKTPIIVNGDKVEYFTDLNKVVAEGNVEIVYKGAKLTCDRITVYTQTKDAFAEGNVRLEDEKTIVLGRSAFYNFDTKIGKIVEANIKVAPYYCVSPEAEKFPTKFILHNADITTCNLDKPHYHFHTKKVEIIPEDKLIARNVKFVTGEAPIMYFPLFVQDISEKRNGFSFTPGQSKEWGSYLISGYRYHFTDDIRGLYRLDWRANKGIGAGFDIESYSDNFGDGRVQWYFVKESLHGEGEVEPLFKRPERYKLEYRHNWNIDEDTQFTLELHKFSDANFLKHYFYRQYEDKPQPESYMLIRHSYPQATLSLLLQRSFNHFFTDIERIPEVKLSTNKFNIMDFFRKETGEIDIDETKTTAKFDLYYQNESSISGLTSRTAYSPDTDEDTVRIDTYNQLSNPFKLAFLSIEPYVGVRTSSYSKDKYGNEWLLRNVFYSGHSISTKFYRIFDNIKINSYGLEIDKLRHIITPSLDYAYIHDPTLPSDRLTAFDSIDSITSKNSLTLSLENKLQTKREGNSVDFVRLIVDSSYDFKLEGHGGRFGDMHFDLEILPNSWLRYDSDAQFDLRRRSFRTANFYLDFLLGEKGKVGAGYRYAASDDDDEVFTFSFERQLNPKWKYRGYVRLQFTARKMYEETEHTLSRDLHCWEVEFTVNSKKNKGVTFWVGFKCKAFPEMGFDFTKSHHQPKNPIP